MLMTRLQCQKCDYNKEFVDKINNSSILKNKECKHFEITLSIIVKDNNFKKYILSIECKICGNEYLGEFDKYQDKFDYICNCNISLNFSYELSIEQKIYSTPYIDKIEKEKENEKKNLINVIIVYENKNYNFTFNCNETLKNCFKQIQDRIKFPNGKKIYNNQNEVDLNKTFIENKINNNYRLQLE